VFVQGISDTYFKRHYADYGNHLLRNTENEARMAHTTDTTGRALEIEAKSSNFRGTTIASQVFGGKGGLPPSYISPP
jgi:hypothetical protein